MDIEKANLKILQKRVLNSIEFLVKKKAKTQYKKVITILNENGYFPTKTHHGYLINIGELSFECLNRIEGFITKEKAEII